MNTVDLDDIYARLDELVAELTQEAQAKGVDDFLLIDTDILNRHYTGFAVGADREQVAAALHEKFDDNDRLALPGVVTRKKQVVPHMTGAFEG